MQVNACGLKSYLALNTSVKHTDLWDAGGKPEALAGHCGFGGAIQAVLCYLSGAALPEQAAQLASNAAGTQGPCATTSAGAPKAPPQLIDACILRAMQITTSACSVTFYIVDRPIQHVITYLRATTCVPFELFPEQRTRACAGSCAGWQRPFEFLFTHR